MKKIIVMILGIIVSGSMFVSCTQNIDDSKKEEIKEGPTEVIDADKYEEEVKKDTDAAKKDDIAKDEETVEKEEKISVEENLKQYFEKNKDYLISNENVINYVGFAETGFNLSLLDVNEEDLVITYSGEMSDGYGEDERGERLFKLEYYFHTNHKDEPIAYERIRNEDYMANSKDNLVSIIKNYIIMWDEIEAGKSWTQGVSIDSKKYTAKTEVESVTSDTFSLSTIINDIEGYSNNTYKEKRTYQKNKGLVEISCTASGMEEEFMVTYSVYEK